MSYRMEFEQWVPFPLEKVFLFFANPQNLPRIMPPASGAKIAAMELVAPPSNGGLHGARQLAGVGSVAVVSVKMFPFLPFRAPWVARIVEFEWNHHFVDIQEKGPFKSWRHRHQFAAKVRDGIHGTLVGDVIEYEVGFGPIGTLAQKLLVSHQLQETFTHRQKILESLLEEK